MGRDARECVANWAVVVVLIGVIVVAAQAVAWFTPAGVTVRDAHDARVEKYVIPDGYSYSGGGMTATGSVITITAEYRREAK